MREALGLHESLYGTRHFRHPPMLVRLAATLNAQERFGEAEALLREAIAAYPRPTSTSTWVAESP